MVPVFNALPHLEAALDSIVEAARTYGNAEIIVVDNGSTDGSLALLRRRYADEVVLLLLPGGNVGAVRNRGAAAGEGAYLSFIDSDCRIPRDYFQQAVEIVVSRDAAATGSIYELPPEPHWVEETWFTLHGRSDDGSTRHIPAGNFFCEREAFEAVGGFDEDLESGEDAELCQRLRSAGFRLWESRRVSAIHLGNPKSISGFFRKQLWHAVGMLGTFRQDWKDVPLLATVAHVILSLTGLVLLFVLGPSVATILGAVLPLLLAVPILSVAYRFYTNRRRANPVMALVLYWVYFAARTVALTRLGWRAAKRSLARAR